MRTLSPASLEETCLNFICTNIEALCRDDNKNGEYFGFPFQRLTFISPIFLHEQLAENIMKTLSCNGKLTTRIATLFGNPNTCRIRKFDLRETEVAASVIKHLLTQHRVLKLDLHGATLSPSILNELLNLVSSTLRELNVSDTSCLDFSSIHPLRCLTHLDVSNTNISDDEVFLASQHLNCLQCLNISHTAVSKTTSFGDLRSQLKTLFAFNAPVAWKNPVEFREFTSLQLLDISRNPDNMSGYDWPSDAEKLEEMLGDKDTMPNLMYLDVSGTPRILDCPLQTFINSHPNLHFLGLCKTGLTSHAKWLPTNIKITGEANEQQILSSLQAYPDRASYMTEALRGLFHCSKKWTERRPEVLQLVLSPLEKHPEDLRVQMAATACVFNIIRGEGTEDDVHPTYLSKIASLALSTMNNFPDKQDLLRNCLLILETRKLLQKANFDFFEACSHALNALCLFSSDQNISRLATKLCAILSSKIATSETLALGSERNIVTLLNIAQEKISGNEADYTLSLTLSVLWNLTDEAPSTCRLFVKKGGLQIAAQGLKAFKDGVQDQHIIVMRKILGTLNNISEVSELRKCLITVDFMNLFGSLLDDQPIQLSYFSGGILSNVLLNWSEDEALPLFIKELTLLKLEKAVKSWELPSEELVSYRSFNPFVELLECSMPAVQMWALWGMLHVCSRSAKRYIPLLVDGGIIEIAEQMIGPSCEGVSELANKLINVTKDSQV